MNDIMENPDFINAIFNELNKLAAQQLIINKGKYNDKNQNVQKRIEKLEKIKG